MVYSTTDESIVPFMLTTFLHHGRMATLLLHTDLLVNQIKMHLGDLIKDQA
jgi:hypothetical protein